MCTSDANLPLFRSLQHARLGECVHVKIASALITCLCTCTDPARISEKRHVFLYMYKKVSLYNETFI